MSLGLDALWTNIAQARGFSLKREGFSLKLEIFAQAKINKKIWAGAFCFGWFDSLVTQYMNLIK